MGGSTWLGEHSKPATISSRNRELSGNFPALLALQFPPDLSVHYSFRRVDSFPTRERERERERVVDEDDENGAARGSDPGGDSLPPAAQEEGPCRGVRQEESPAQERVLPPARSRVPLRPLSQESTLPLNTAPASPKKRPPTAACYKSKRRAPAENGRIHPPGLDSLYATTLRRKSYA
ncbi:unnamed protein product [Musa acuminata subsp. malaccensis]|uniref:(wild Malaysian banana) hypothetical protein n=1 Tax=Musa acuminata subsp. malaccensis TaxID=214687 RepID=A0A804JDD9_MUSAM|nr:unnamed protein product [Musa acuminata subsp. malaccensis]